MATKTFRSDGYQGPLSTAGQTVAGPMGPATPVEPGMPPAGSIKYSMGAGPGTLGAMTNSMGSMAGGLLGGGSGSGPGPWDAITNAAGMGTGTHPTAAGGAMTNAIGGAFGGGGGPQATTNDGMATVGGGGWWDAQGPYQGPGAMTNTGTDWIGQSLQEAQSTDDPSYWQQQIAKDPKAMAGDQSAIDYWKMRIGRGDGALAVRNGTQSTYGGNSGGPGGMMSPWTQQFQAPDVTQDPGYKFRMEQGQQALERSAAAKGTLLTGGTLKDLAGYSQGLASQEYGNAYNRALTEYGIGRDNFYASQDRPFEKDYKLAQLGLQGAGTLGNLGSSNAQNVGEWYTQQGNAGAQGTIGAAGAWNDTLGNMQNMYQDWYARTHPQQGPNLGSNMPPGGPMNAQDEVYG